MIDLKVAKYKGVEFLWTSLETEGGNRNVGMTFPGSGLMSVQRQGAVPRKFTIKAIIQHDDYYARRDNLIRVLEDGEKGPLVHPTWGLVENVAAGEFKLSESLSQLGRAEIEINFSVDDAPGIPVRSGNLASQVQQEADAGISQASGDMSNTFSVSPNFPANTSDAIDAGTKVAASFADAADLSAANPDKSSKFRAALNNFSDNIGTLVTDASAYADAVTSQYEAMIALYDDPDDVLQAMLDMFNYGSDDPQIMETTAGRIERKRNRDILRTFMIAVALCYAYQYACQSEYTTNDDLVRVRETLENQYIELRENLVVSNDLMEQIDRVRVQAEKTLDTVGVNTRSIITINVQRQPLSILVYSLYGNTDNFDTIADLNAINQNAFVEGDVQVLTA